MSRGREGQGAGTTSVPRAVRSLCAVVVCRLRSAHHTEKGGKGEGRTGTRGLKVLGPCSLLPCSPETRVCLDPDGGEGKERGFSREERTVLPAPLLLA